MQIVIKKTYFDNIKVAIDAMNNFFASSFKTKAFPVVNDDFQLDKIIARTLSWLNNIEPEWVDNPDKAIQALQGLKNAVETAEPVQEGVGAVIGSVVFITALSAIIRGIQTSIRQSRYEKNTPIDQKLLDKIERLLEIYKTVFEGNPAYPDPWGDEDDFEQYTSDNVWDIAWSLTQVEHAVQDTIKANSPLYQRFPGTYETFSQQIKEIADTLNGWLDLNTSDDWVDFHRHVDGGIPAIKAKVEEALNVLWKFATEIRDKIDLMKSDEYSTESVQEAAEDGYDAETIDQQSPWFNVLNGTNQTAQDYLHAFIGFKMLQYITEHFDQFEELLNGIYSFELFTSPAAYRSAIETFTTPIPIPEIDAIAKFPGEYKLFDSADYVQSIFSNDQIKLPEDMMADTEIQRFEAFQNLQDCEIVIDDTVQEAAAVNYFKEAKPQHITYDAKKNKWKISKQFEAAVDRLLKGLHACDNTDEVLQYFSGIPANDPIMFAQNVIPYIYANLLAVKKKEWDNPATADENFKKYSKSYASIIRKNNGAKRFARYDIITTFRNDKTGTIQFIEDFMKLRLVNDENCAISNSIILTLFNIFDSRIYLDIMYNLIPDDVKKEKYPTEDGFVKLIRARINKNSRVANPYQQKETEVNNTVQTSDQVTESVYETIKTCFDIEPSEMRHNGAFMEAVYQDIETLGDALFNAGMSQIKIDHYIGESHDLFTQEQEIGNIPDYMKERILFQQQNKPAEQQKPAEQPVSGGSDIDVGINLQDLNIDIPMNNFDELADSIEARLDTPGAKSLSDMLGSGYQGSIGDKGGRGMVVYNITYNTNSHNTSHTVTNDLSSGKTTTHVDMSQNKRTNASGRNKPTNNYDNTSPSSNSKESANNFSNGKSIQEVFALLYSEEPLFVESDAGSPPKGDLLTTAMDVDRQTLSAQQKVKRGVQKVGNTVRATVKPVKRTKMWLRKMVDSVIKRDEDRVKADLVENPSYRSALYKTARIALKAGKFAVFNAISPYLGVAYLGVQGLKLADKERLRREANDEIATEIKIIDQKIENLKNRNYYDKMSPESEEEMYRLMRIRAKLVKMGTNAFKRSGIDAKSAY